MDLLKLGMEVSFIEFSGNNLHTLELLLVCQITNCLSYCSYKSILRFVQRDL